MTDKTNQVIAKLDSFRDTEINENIILTVLRIQSLCKETEQDGSIN